jgi:hypothetical protein
MCINKSDVTKTHKKKKKKTGSLFIHFTTCSNSTEKLILIKALIQREYEEIHKQHTTTESAFKNVLIPK